MTWYEVIISCEETGSGIDISGWDRLANARSFLDKAAKDHKIPGFESVEIQTKPVIPGDLLVQMLQFMDEPWEWVEVRNQYAVYLSEV